MVVKFFESIKFETQKRKLFINNKKYKLKRSLSCFCICKIETEIYVVGYRQSDETYIVYSLPTKYCKFRKYRHWKISPCDYFMKYIFIDCEVINNKGEIIFYDNITKRFLYTKDITRFPLFYKGKIQSDCSITTKKIEVLVV